jgi:hypothetical protein
MVDQEVVKERIPEFCAGRKGVSNVVRIRG